MCGFVGFIDKNKNKDTVLESMMNTIIHRGPDSSGKYIDDNVALGHRRLSIIDISNSGDQPIFNEDKNLVLVFNGEIYNYQDLKEELVKQGHVFTTNTDSETLLHGYEQWGSEMLLKLRGMFAFVIWDKNTNKLFGARDYFGIKPFYYTEQEESFIFGSEIKSFIPHPGFKKVFNEKELGNYLTFQFVPSNETFFKGVFCLPPGHFMEYENGKLSLTQYYEFDFKCDNKNSLEEITDQVKDIMEDSVKMHKISDVEVASYLSSGVDSSYLTYLSQADRTFTVGFDEGKYSEINDAKDFAKSINMSNDAKVISPDEYWDALSDIMYYMDEPVADPSAIALYFLSQEASKKVKVVLSGEGSDELFGGYNIYCEPLEHRGFDKIPFPIRKAMGAFARNFMPKGMKGKGFLIRHSKTLEDRYYSNATNVFNEKDARKILKNNNGPNIKSITAPLYKDVKDKDPVSKMQYVDLHIWLVHDILMKGDKMGMANSIEVRVPFLDKEVMEYALSLPLNKKVVPPRTKIALREAADKVIQKKTAEKKKLGFPIPTRVWLREDKYYNKVKDMFLSESAKKFFDTDALIKLLDDHKEGKVKNEKTDDSRRIWTVYIFLVWYERFFVKM